MSTHRVDVFTINQIEPHPNADSLVIVRVIGFICCVKLDQYKPGSLAVYIEPDMVVDMRRAEFEFMRGMPGAGVAGNNDLYRIKVKKLRGIISQGLIIPAPSGSRTGDNVIDQLGITRYEPPINPTAGGEAEGAPSNRYAPCYDVENWRRFQHLLQVKEPVLITEKIHGCNARFLFHPKDGVDRMYCGSRVEWKRQSDGNLWWQALKQNPWIEDFCKTHPEITLYGEVFGQVADLKYGAQKNSLFVRIFDILVGNEWLSWSVIKTNYTNIIPHWVPILFEGSYDPSAIEALAEGKSLISGADHLREGIVVQPLVERTHPEIGRVKLKVVSNAYLSR